jgi:hypothetical protein
VERGRGRGRASRAARTNRSAGKLKSGGIISGDWAQVDDLAALMRLRVREFGAQLGQVGAQLLDLLAQLAALFCRRTRRGPRRWDYERLPQMALDLVRRARSWTRSQNGGARPRRPEAKRSRERAQMQTTAEARVAQPFAKPGHSPRELN